MEVEHIKTWHSVGIDIAALALYALIAAGAECLVAGTGEEEHTHILGLAGICHSVEHLHDGLRTEGIVDFRTVDCDTGHSAMLFKEYVGILFYLFPFSHLCEEL